MRAEWGPRETERAARADTQDFAISVAAIHHLSTPERRRDAVRTLLRPLSSSGRFFIYVWAYEQGPNSRRKMGSLADAADPSKGRVQDVLVPWVLSSDQKTRAKGEPRRRKIDTDRQETGEREPGEAKEEGKVFHRYYHLFVEGELESLVRDAAAADGFEVLEKDDTPEGKGKFLRIRDVGWEADNWWIDGEVGEA